MQDKGLRIGEVARRTGVAVETLRAWERRYEVLAPERTPGGHRLYGESDVARVRAMNRLIDEGWAAGSAAKEVLRDAGSVVATTGVSAVETLRQRLHLACEALDGAAAQAVLDDTFARFQLVTAFDEVVLPVLRHIGDGWDRDARAIAREHFTSNLVRPRLLRLIQASGSLGRRVCVAAAPEHEEHDLGLLSAAVTAASIGWSIRYLGARTPTAALLDTVELARPQVVLIGAVRREPAEAFLAETAELEPPVPFVVGGSGFRPEDVSDRPRWRYHHNGMTPLEESLSDAARA